jgi:hypothetical protein
MYAFYLGSDGAEQICVVFLLLVVQFVPSISLTECKYFQKTNY